MESLEKEAFHESTAMDSEEIKTLMNKLGLTYRIIDLSEIDGFDELYAVVHTGQVGNEANSGINNHWCAIYGKYFFCSYGKYSSYALPKWIDPVDTVPRQLQSFDSNVCGMYACAFIKFCEDKQNVSSDPGREFSLQFDFDTDRKENDAKILHWSKQI
jgi:hypothetical protein